MPLAMLVQVTVLESWAKTVFCHSLFWNDMPRLKVMGYAGSALALVYMTDRMPPRYLTYRSVLLLISSR